MTDLYVDYSFARPDPNLIKANGYTGVMRYLAPPSGGAKILGKAEAQALLAAGLGVGVVWESSNSRAAAGQAAGQADALAAERQADALGYPADCPIFYAVDFDADGPVVAPYFTGVKSAARRPVGVYGSARVVEHIIVSGLAVYGWQTGAWSHGVITPTAHLYQRIKTPPIAGTDENEVRKPFPMWGLGTPAPDAPVEDEDVTVYYAKGDKADDIYALDTTTGYRRKIDPPEWAWVSASGAKLVTIPQAQFDAVPKQPAVTVSGTPPVQTTFKMDGTLTPQ